MNRIQRMYGTRAVALFYSAASPIVDRARLAAQSYFRRDGIMVRQRSSNLKVATLRMILARYHSHIASRKQIDNSNSVMVHTLHHCLVKSKGKIPRQMFHVSDVLLSTAQRQRTRKR